MKKRTLGDHIEATRLRANGAASSMDGRYERLSGLVFDGRPLRDHELSADKEPAKRIEEMHAVGYALVGCEVDLELASLRSLRTRKGRATADFEATTRDGNEVRIELGRLVDPAEKMYLNALGEIVRRCRDVLAVISELDQVTGGGTIFVRFFGGVPTSKDIPFAAAELAQVILHDVPSKGISPTLWPVAGEYTTLHRLGAHWAHDNREGPTSITVDPSRQVGDKEATRAQFFRLVRHKAEKIADYSEGKPVWLVTYVDSRLFYPLGIVESLAEETTLNPRPFDRVMVGCFTAGVVFSAGCAPRYVSLTRG